MIAKLRLLFWLGVVTLFIPYFGITDGIRRVLTIVVGALIIYITLRLRKGYKQLKYQLRKVEEQEVVMEPSKEASA